MNVKDKTFLVIAQDDSGLILADVTNGWSGIGHSNLVKIAAAGTSDGRPDDIEVRSLREGA